MPQLTRRFGAASESDVDPLLLANAERGAVGSAAESLDARVGVVERVSVVGAAAATAGELVDAAAAASDELAEARACFFLGVLTGDEMADGEALRSAPEVALALELVVAL